MTTLPSPASPRIPHTCAAAVCFSNSSSTPHVDTHGMKPFYHFCTACRRAPRCRCQCRQTASKTCFGGLSGTLSHRRRSVVSSSECLLGTDGRPRNTETTIPGRRVRKRATMLCPVLSCSAPFPFLSRPVTSRPVVPDLSDLRRRKCFEML